MSTCHESEVSRLAAPGRPSGRISHILDQQSGDLLGCRVPSRLNQSIQLNYLWRIMKLRTRPKAPGALAGLTALGLAGGLAACGGSSDVGGGNSGSSSGNV